jgi:hypothetical protein
MVEVHEFVRQWMLNILWAGPDRRLFNTDYEKS